MQPQIFNAIPAGVFPTDTRANIFACHETKKVFFIQGGKVNHFKDLPNEYKKQITTRFLQDPCARKELGHMGFTAGIEKYAKCMFGALDAVPDFAENGQLQTNDNYRCSDNCKCMFWKSKKIIYQKEEFTNRQLQCLELIAKGLTDIEIADQMQITVNGLSDYKRRLQKKLNTYCKTSTAVKAIKQKLVR